MDPPRGVERRSASEGRLPRSPCRPLRTLPADSSARSFVRRFVPGVAECMPPSSPGKSPADRCRSRDRRDRRSGVLGITCGSSRRSPIVSGFLAAHLGRPGTGGARAQRDIAAVACQTGFSGYRCCTRSDRLVGYARRSKDLTKFEHPSCLLEAMLGLVLCSGDSLCFRMFPTRLPLRGIHLAINEPFAKAMAKAPGIEMGRLRSGSATRCAIAESHGTNRMLPNRFRGCAVGAWKHDPVWSGRQGSGCHSDPQWLRRHLLPCADSGADPSPAPGSSPRSG